MSLTKLKESLEKRKSTSRVSAPIIVTKPKLDKRSSLKEETEFQIPSPVPKKRNSLDSMLIIEKNQILDDSEILERLFPLNLTNEAFSFLLMNLFDKTVNQNALEFHENVMHNSTYHYTFSSESLISCLVNIETFPKKQTLNETRDLAKLFGERLTSFSSKNKLSSFTTSIYKLHLRIPQRIHRFFVKSFLHFRTVASRKT
jgi:hypothetical protein